MSNEQRLKLAATINKQLDYLKQEIEATKKSLEPVATQCSKSDPQRAEQMQNQEIIYKNFAFAQRRYNSLLETKKCLNDEDFGLCIVCDEAIAFERLLLIPETKQCITCAKENSL